MSRRILITGYSGHLGKEFVRRHTNTYDFIGLTRAKTELIDNEILWEMDEPLPALDKPVDTILHFAWTTDIAYCEDHKDQALATNLGGTLRLLQWGKDNAARFVFISTGSVYTPWKGPCPEDAPHDPRDFYNLTKSLGEKLCNHYANQLEMIVIRPFFPFGPGTKLGRLIDNLCDRVRNGHVVTLNEDGAPHTNPIYVDDFSAALSTVITCQNPAQAYNFGGPEILNIQEMAEQIGELVGRKPVFEHSGKTSSHFIGDINRLKNLYEFKFSFQDGLKRMIGGKRESYT